VRPETSDVAHDTSIGLNGIPRNATALAQRGPSPFVLPVPDGAACSFGPLTD
jgi:hypothetical protein